MEKSVATSKKSSLKINLSNIYTEKEIESMKKVFPKLSSLITTLPSISTKRPTTNVTKSDKYVDRDQFVNLLKEKMMNSLKKEDSEIIAKSFSYIFNDDNEPKKQIKNKGNTGISGNLTKNPISMKVSAKSKINGDIVFFQQRPKKKSFYEKKTRNKNNFPIMKKSIKLDVNTISNTMRNKFGKKYIDIKYDNDPSDFRIKNIKSNSIINNFITFSNMPQPEQIIVYGNNSSNSRKSTFSTHSNNMNPKSAKKKIHPFNIISNRFATDKSKNKNYIKKYNTRRSQENKYSINFMKKMEKIKTEVNLSKRKTTILKNKRQSDITKILKTRINLANITNMNNSTQVQKKVKVQMFTNPNTKESETIRNINIISNKSIEEKDFDIFNFESKVGMENTLYLIGSYIYKKFDFSKIIKEKKFVNWAKKIASGYSRLNPYHTDLHAADVAQTCFLILLQEGVKETSKVDNVDICSLILSCMCHDYKHGGLNNNFLRLTKDKLAIRYNDISILENMHISQTFKLINTNKECNIFFGVNNATYEKMRKKMIACVLSTDMFYHSKHVEFMKDIIAKKNIKQEDNQQFMNLLIHSADVSNPTKPFGIYLKWAKLVFEEFCQQGDKEKALGLVCTCDRNTVKLNANQIGFIDYVVEGFVSSFVQIFPSLKFLHDNLVTNREKFVNYKEEDDNKYGNNKKLIKK